MDTWDEPYGKQSIPGGIWRSKGSWLVKGPAGMRLGLEGAGTERTEVLVGRGALWLGFGQRGASVKIVSLVSMASGPRELLKAVI